MFRVEVSVKPGCRDSLGESARQQFLLFGAKGISEIRLVRCYEFEDLPDRQAAETIAKRLLVDEVIEDYSLGDGTLRPLDELRVQGANDVQVLEIRYLPGVFDEVAESLAHAIPDLGIPMPTRVETVRKYVVKGDIAPDELRRLAVRAIYNPVIERIGGGASRSESAEYVFEGPKTVELSMLGVEELRTLSRNAVLSLSDEEMLTVQKHFRERGREPTDVELETIAQTWSEHCCHKTFRGEIRCDGQTVRSMLKTYIMRETQELAKPWCISVFSDNAGVVEFDDKHAICFKCETHNHPSAIEPFGGTHTGIGGVIRDILGVGLGAEPILCTDVFCFAMPDFPWDQVPAGIAHPRQAMSGFVAGVSDYGNKIGIPTVNGAIYFHNGYAGNPIILAGCLGIMPRDKCFKKVNAGDLVVLIGGKTGRDGIHGATFSSRELDTESETESRGCVQIGNPIEEQKMIRPLLTARDRGLFSAVTDCGGGGLSSAVGEMGRDTGVEVDLERVPLKYAGLTYTEIWISESQERMLFAVPPENVAEFTQVFEDEEVQVSVIGRFTDSGRLVLRYNGQVVCDLEDDFLHGGCPTVSKEAMIRPKSCEPAKLPEETDYGGALLDLLASPNICSREAVVRQYDHEVQGGSVLKPYGGRFGDAPSDAAVVRPVPGSDRGIAVGNGFNPNFGARDAYGMAASAIEEAIRNVIAAGGRLDRVALLDNFTWGDVADPETLGDLLEATRACYEVGKAFGAPFISGKDSLNNFYVSRDEKVVSVPPTLFISAMTIVDDVHKTVSSDFKKSANPIYVIGATYDELGGSEYGLLRGVGDGVVPNVRPEESKLVMAALEKAIQQGLVAAAHDCSEGGIGVALAEMAIGGRLGFEVELGAVPLGESIAQDSIILFSESNGRFVVEVRAESRQVFEQLFAGIAAAKIGHVTEDGFGRVRGLDGRQLLAVPVKQMVERWKGGVQW